MQNGLVDNKLSGRNERDTFKDWFRYNYDYTYMIFLI